MKSIIKIIFFKGEIRGWDEERIQNKGAKSASFISRTASILLLLLLLHNSLIQISIYLICLPNCIMITRQIQAKCGQNKGLRLILARPLKPLASQRKKSWKVSPPQIFSEEGRNGVKEGVGGGGRGGRANTTQHHHHYSFNIQRRYLLHIKFPTEIDYRCCNCCWQQQQQEAHLYFSSRFLSEEATVREGGRGGPTRKYLAAHPPLTVSEPVLNNEVPFRIEFLQNNSFKHNHHFKIKYYYYYWKRQYRR